MRKVNAATGLDNARFLLDLYHLAMNGEDLPAVIARHAGITGHVQIADSPGRGAPGTGSLPLALLLDTCAGHGYTGWTGLEYKPSAGRQPGQLRLAPRYRAAPRRPRPAPRMPRAPPPYPRRHGRHRR